MPKWLASHLLEIEPGASPVTLDLHGSPTAYLHLDFCGVQVAGES
jgi:hypothetical protein